MSTESDRPNMEGRPAAEVDRIRDIIFGPQMRLYEQQFKRAASQLDLLNKQLEEIRATIDRQRIDQESRMRQVQEELHERDVELERSFSDRLGQLEASLEEQTTQLRAESRRSLAELRDELSQALDALQDDKTGRHDLGDLLVEMGTRLKEQIGVADLLGQLTQLAEDRSTD